MSSSICGNCQNFKPKKGDKFFNCTSATHAGVKYGMQVRADTRSCDSFLPFGTSPKPAPLPVPTLQPEPEPEPKLEPKPKPSSQPKPAGKQKPKPLSTSKPKTVAEPKREPKLKPTPKPQEPSSEDLPRPTGLCVWGRVILVTALVLVIGLPAWGIYSCASKSTSMPLPTPAPMPANAVVKYFDIGENILATGPGGTITVSSAEELTSYSISSGETFKAPSGKAFVFITVTCKNTGNTSFLTGPAYFLLTDSAGHSYKDQTYGDYSFSKPYPNAILTPSVTVTGKILWLVPVSASGLEVSVLLDTASNPPVIARWKLPQ